MLPEDFALAGSFAIEGPCLPEADQKAPVIAVAVRESSSSSSTALLPSAEP